MTNQQLERLHFNDEDIMRIERWAEYLSKGAFGNSKEITETYNRVFDGVMSKVNVTSCGSCLRNRINTLNNALKEWRVYNESENASKNAGNTPIIDDNPSGDTSVPREENNATETKSEDNGKTRKLRKAKE